LLFQPNQLLLQAIKLLCLLALLLLQLGEVTLQRW
jgi:hypothetical protein